MWRTLISAFGWGSFIGCGWSTPPSTTSGPKPYEHHFLRGEGHLTLALAFSPQAFIQSDSLCIGRYLLRLTIWEGLRPLFYGEKRLIFYANAMGFPHTSNLYFWNLPLAPTPYPLHCLIECQDLQTYHLWVDTNTILPNSFNPLFLSCEGNLCSFSEILSHTALLLIAPTPIVEVVLYQRESKLPGTQRYLSLQEQRFIGVKTNQLDTLRLSWHKEELTPEAYLVGIYAYKGRIVVAEAFRQVFRKASPSKRPA